MQSYHLINMYKKYHPFDDIKYGEFYKNFRNDFYSSAKYNFSEIIMIYSLDENFVFESRNLLGHLACFCNDDNDINFFKEYFTPNQLKHMAEYNNCIGSNVFHFAYMQIENIKLLRFLLTLSKNFNDKNTLDKTPLETAINEYGKEYVLNSLWGKTLLEEIKNLPIENEEIIGKKRKIKRLSDLIQVAPFPKQLNFD